MTEPVKIAIILEGGCVSTVLSAGVPVDFVVIDYDTEYSEKSDIFMAPQINAEPVECVGWSGEAEIVGAHVIALFAANEAKDEPSPLHTAAALVRDGLALLDTVEGIEDIEIEDGQMKVIANGRCFRVSVEVLS